MNNKRINIFLASYFCILIGVTLLYFLLLREFTILAFYNKAPEWFNQIVSFLYPRFFVEKKRFSAEFFLDKADQVIVRFIFVSFIIMLFTYFKNKSENFCIRLNEFWAQKTSVSNVTILRILYFTIIIVIFKDIYWDLMDLYNAKIFYRPILFYKLLGVSFPSTQGIIVICIILLFSSILCIINIAPILNAIIAVGTFIYIQGLIFSFEKIDHGFATVTYAGMIMPFLLYENRIAKKSKSYDQKGWPLLLIQLVICLCYLMSGLEKIFISKFQWLHPETLKVYLLIHQTPLGIKLAANNFLCTLLPTLVIIFQLVFISILFSDKLKYIILPVGIIFHISVYYLFDVGGFQNPWIFSYIFFIDWTIILKKIKSFKISRQAPSSNI